MLCCSTLLTGTKRIVGLDAASRGVAVVGFTFEYYLGINRTQAHTLGGLEAMGEQPTSAHKFLGE